MAKTGKKGLLLEELLRAYFIRAGMYVVRGAPLKIDGDDLTDVDLWLYERPTGSSRRRQIVDVKSKSKPKAVERLLWTKGLCELLNMDGAYVATTDYRPILRNISSQLGISVLDGTDLKRMAESDRILFEDRLSEEDLEKLVKAIDRGRRNKNLQLRYYDMKAGLIDEFGAGTVNRALEHFVSFAQVLGSSHPNSGAAEVALRLSYLAASIIAVTLDFSLAKVPFKSAEERRKTLLNVIRFGSEDEATGMEKVRVATALIERYTPNGTAAAQSMLNLIQADFENVPAEIVADHVLSKLKGDALFQMARTLEYEGFKSDIKGFDQLEVETKSFIGVLLDFAVLERSSFADAWCSSVSTKDNGSALKISVNKEQGSLGPLFER